MHKLGFRRTMREPESTPLQATKRAAKHPTHELDTHTLRAWAKYVGAKANMPSNNMHRMSREGHPIRRGGLAKSPARKRLRQNRAEPGHVDDPTGHNPISASTSEECELTEIRSRRASKCTPPWRICRCCEFWEDLGEIPKQLLEAVGLWAQCELERSRLNPPSGPHLSQACWCPPPLCCGRVPEEGMGRRGRGQPCFQPNRRGARSALMTLTLGD